MKPRFHHSMPARLAGMILLFGGVALLILTEINRRAVERILADQAEIQALQSTTNVADGIDAVVGSVDRLAKTIARDLEGRRVTSDEVTRIARNVMVNQSPVYGFVIALDAQRGDGPTDRIGVYIHRSRTSTKLTERDLTSGDQAYWSREWYRDAVAKGVPIWSEPYFDQGGADRNVVRLSVPFFATSHDSQPPIGVVSAIIDLEWLRRLANASAFSESSYILVFSRSGKLLVHPNPAYVAVETLESLGAKENVPELALIHQSVIARRQGVLTYVEPLHHRRLHADYKPTKTAGWGVLVGYDDSEFLKPQRAFRRVAAIYLGLTILALGGIVIVVTRRALGPLEHLARAANEIAGRNLECAIPEVRRHDEIGLLARAFRSMRDALKAQHVERKWASQSLEHQLKYNNLIVDSISELVFVVTKGLNILRINPAVTRATGYTLKDLLRAPIGKVVRFVETPDRVETLIDAVITKRLLDGAESVQRSAVIVAKDGERLAAHLNFAAVQDGGQIVGLVATLRLEQPIRQPSTR